MAGGKRRGAEGLRYKMWPMAPKSDVRKAENTMKTILSCSTMLILSATLAAAQTPAADTGYTATLRASWNSVKRFVVSSAEKMPDANYGFKPTPEVRSFGELIGHLANEHYLLCSPLKGEKNPMADV